MTNKNRERLFKGHSWLKLMGQKSKCTKCGLIRVKTQERHEYSKDNVQFETLPDCN